MVVSVRQVHVPVRHVLERIRRPASKGRSTDDEQVNLLPWQSLGLTRMQRSDLTRDCIADSVRDRTGVPVHRVIGNQRSHYPCPPPRGEEPGARCSSLRLAPRMRPRQRSRTGWESCSVAMSCLAHSAARSTSPSISGPLVLLTKKSPGGPVSVPPFSSRLAAILGAA